MGNAKRDDNYVTTLIAVSNADGITPVTLYADPTTHRLLVSATAGSLNDLSDVVITSAAQGDILYYNGTNWVNLAAGASGKFLKTQGAGANPIWDTATAGAAGSDTQVQFNDGGSAIGADAGFTYNKTTDAVSANGGFLPITNDTGALGSATKSFSDLFLASGAVINFANGDVVLTHSTGVLTLTTGTLALGANNLTMTGSIGATAARVTKGWFVDAEFTNVPTIGGNALGTIYAAIAQTFYIGTTQVAINRASAGLTLAGITLTTPDIGTPSAGVLTNCTGLPIAGLAASTVTAIGVGSIELGHASDTTITRTGAGAIAVEGVAVLLSGGALGTPSSGTLTNCTGLPVAGLVSSTSTALGVGSLELGHASDTTIARVSAGLVSIEGVNIVTVSATQTLTNKRVTERVVTTTDDSTAVIDVDVTDQYQLTAMANATTISTTGTPTAGQKLIIRLKDNATARALTWDAVFRAVGVTLPTTTVISKTVYIGCIYNATDSKWDAVAVAQEA